MIESHFNIKLRLGRGFKTDAENASVAIRQRLGLSSNDRLPAKHLASNLKINIAHPDQVTGMGKAALEELLVKNPREWSAIFLPAPAPKRSLIIHNPTNGEHRQESDIFHELSHLLCGHEPDKFVMIGGIPMRRFPEDKEDEAQFLGYALHIPRNALFWALKKGMTKEEIGDRFCASQQVVTMRINCTGVGKILARR